MQKTFLVFSLLQFLISTASAQSPAGSISVKVLDASNGRAITFGSVEATNRSPNPHLSVLRASTSAAFNRNGRPSILNGLEPGADYEVHAWSTGAYDEQRRIHVKVLSGKTTYLTISLHPISNLRLPQRPVPVPPPAPANTYWMKKAN
ncbi:MAG: hypothetical protein Q8916_10345 [Bacteroidota bacterium]|nr:hypothetical protein [Bacteroidota bacterium]MDP4230788.1 hypothetical protein [Bacteroidota bacterium]MDP4235915.1 hypothetical protein [Bacteroidota bacterium]